MKNLLLTIAICFLSILVLFLTLVQTGNPCTNLLITKGASLEGATMISYTADSHTLYGELYYWPAADYPEGTMMDVYDWDTGKLLGRIKQALHTYSVVGNINEHQLAIGETTFGGREELQDTTSLIDYGSIIYITLQRARTAREAIHTIAQLIEDYGYYSHGESFSISDPNEVWIMEIVGKGTGSKSAVWVAVRIPDGYMSAHANQSRITAFPLNDTMNCYYSNDVISFARQKGYFNGKDEDFSFCDAYAPPDFGALRFCEARVWAAFNRVKSGMDKYLDYVMGDNPKNKMPLYIKPDKLISVYDAMELMRDHFQGTPMDMTKDMGAGPFLCPYRWRPLEWKVDGKTYFNERATSTQQTGFSFVTQSRSYLPDPIGGIIWFGVDDSYSTVYTPMYCGITEVPPNFAEGNGSMMVFSDSSAFWLFNLVSNFAYTRYKDIIPEIRTVQNELEMNYINEVSEIDKKALDLYTSSPEEAREILTAYSLGSGKKTFDTWKNLFYYLFTKYMDGNIKTVVPGQKNPKVSQPGYGEDWNRRIVKDTGEKLKVKEVKY
ncbi:MAG: dipeptidase [Ignavibacteria bacterium]|nr:dipeptidase [Ignavibacteria bacterium]